MMAFGAYARAREDRWVFRVSSFINTYIPEGCSANAFLLSNFNILTRLPYAPRAFVKQRIMKLRWSTLKMSDEYLKQFSHDLA